MAPLISIITITYNAAKVLPPTVDSIMAQSFRDFEHIVVDGASTDDILAIARRNPSARILSEPDRGLYDAMNKGLHLARGRYVLFLNAGDAFHSPDVLASYAERAKMDDDIIYADTVIVNTERKVTGNRHHTAPQRLTFESFSKGMLICHQAFMVKRSLAPDYNLAYRFSADYDWTIRCIRNSNPDRNTNLNLIAIDYLSDGLTDKNHFKSLRERYRIMCNYYGSIPTLLHHIALVGKSIFKH